MKNHFFKIIMLFILLPAGIKTYAQGYVMLAGGGGEVAGGWSDIPYRWVVEHAKNKRIAVITYETGATQWIPNYFKSLGAVAANNFIINSRTGADLQQLYDSLITYSGIFIKGGDQYKYYEYYKGTKTQAAIQYVYNNGGVISGTSAGTAILSPIVFTAEIASVDPAAALLNAYTSQITLENDFLNTFPERYIYDTHFIERGRFGRLPAFMATWFKTKKEITTGIGVDDHTALCIDVTRNANIYGTGAVGFFNCLNQSLPFDTTSVMLKSDKIKFVQLLHGCSVNLKTGITSGLSQTIKFNHSEENTKNTLFFSGTDYPSDDACNYFVNLAGHSADTITIVTGNNTERAAGIKLKFTESGAKAINIIQAIQGNESNAAIKQNIETAKKLVFVANEYSVFMDFLKKEGNGSLLNKKVRQSEVLSFFVGDNARYAGTTVINKYTGFGAASYNGELQFLPGMALLKTTAIMPNAFINSQTYENTVSGIPYSMVLDSLKYGFYITGNTFATYSYDSNNTSYFKNISGSFPLISLINTGVKADVANQGPGTKSRNIAGFESMNLRFLAVNDTVVVGKHVLSGVKKLQSADFSIYPNPASNMLFIQAVPGKYDIQIFDFSGKLMFEKSFINKTEINTSHLNTGIYIALITDKNSHSKFSSKFQVIQ